MIHLLVIEINNKKIAMKTLKFPGIRHATTKKSPKERKPAAPMRTPVVTVSAPMQTPVGTVDCLY
jgi:hypothetical protein